MLPSDTDRGIAIIPLPRWFGARLLARLKLGQACLGKAWQRAGAMKTFTIAAVILSVLAMPAHAQARRPQTDEKKAKDDRPKVDEKAYKAALERIPEPKEKYDPWAVTK